MSWPEISMKQGQTVYPAAPQLSWTVAAATQMTSISLHLYSKPPRVTSNFRQIIDNTKINQIRSWRRIDTKLYILPTNSFSVFMVFTQALRLGGQSHFSLNYYAPYSLCAACSSSWVWCARSHIWTLAFSDHLLTRLQQHTPSQLTAAMFISSHVHLPTNLRLFFRPLLSASPTHLWTVCLSSLFTGPRPPIYSHTVYRA